MIMTWRGVCLLLLVVSRVTPVPNGIPHEMDSPISSSKEMSSSSTPASKTTTTITPGGKKEVEMTKEEVKSSKREILIKQFGESKLLHY